MRDRNPALYVQLLHSSICRSSLTEIIHRSICSFLGQRAEEGTGGGTENRTSESLRRPTVLQRHIGQTTVTHILAETDLWQTGTQQIRHTGGVMASVDSSGSSASGRLRSGDLLHAGLAVVLLLGEFYFSTFRCNPSLLHRGSAIHWSSGLFLEHHSTSLGECVCLCMSAFSQFDPLVSVFITLVHICHSKPFFFPYFSAPQHLLLSSPVSSGQTHPHLRCRMFAAVTCDVSLLMGIMVIPPA